MATGAHRCRCAARAALAADLDDDEPDVIWCAGAEAFLAVPKRLQDRAVVDYVDLPSRNRRELARVAAHRIGRRIAHDGGVDASVFGLAREVQGGIRSRLVERYVGRRARAVTVASPTEARGGGPLRAARASTTPGIVAPPGDQFPVTHFVFPGSFLYPPHQDAAEWFALYVLPPLRKLLPACRIVFAGPYPDWMPSFAELHGIELTGRARDIGAVLDARSVVIAPIRAGSGTIVEVIDAWARGVPVVAIEPRRRGPGGRATASTCSSPTIRPSSPPAARWRRATRSCGRRSPATGAPATRPSSRGR